MERGSDKSTRDGETGPRVVQRVKDVAAAFSKSVRSVDGWRRNGMPGSPGNWDLDEITKWLETREQSQKRGRRKEQQALLPLEDGTNLDHWDLRFRRARARSHELDLAHRRGELVPKSEILHAFLGRCLELKRGLMQAGRALAPRLVGLSAEEMCSAIETAHRQLLLAFARGGIRGIKDEEQTRIQAYIQSGTKPPRKPKRKKTSPR